MIMVQLQAFLQIYYIYIYVYIYSDNCLQAMGQTQQKQNGPKRNTRTSARLSNQNREETNHATNLAPVLH